MPPRGRPRKHALPDEIDLQPTFVDQTDEIIQVLESIGASPASLRLWRLTSGRAAYLRTYNANEFSLDGVRAEFGGSRFRLDISIEDTKQKITKFFEVEGEPRYVGKIPGYASTDGTRNRFPDSPTIVNNIPSGDTTLIDELRQLRAEVAKSKEQNIVYALVEGLIKRESDTEDKFMARMAAMKNLFAPSAATTATSEIVNAVKTGMDLVSSAEGGSGPAQSPWLALAEKALPAILGLVSKIQFPQQPLEAVTVPPVEHGAAFQLPKPNGHDMQAQQLTGFASIAPKLKEFLPVCLSHASANGDPNIVIDLALTNIPPQYFEIVKEWLNGKTWFADLCTLSPMISAQAAWWNDFHDEFLTALNEPATTDNDVSTAD